MFRCYCIQNVKDGIQIQVYNINNESVNHFSQFMSVKVKKNVRKSQAQFREKLRKLRLRQNNDFLIKKKVYKIFHFNYFVKSACDSAKHCTHILPLKACQLLEPRTVNFQYNISIQKSVDVVFEKHHYRKDYYAFCLKIQNAQHRMFLLMV